MKNYRLLSIIAALLVLLALPLTADARGPRPSMNSWGAFVSPDGSKMGVVVEIKRAESVTICFGGTCKSGYLMPSLSSDYWTASFDSRGLHDGARVSVRVIATNKNGSRAKAKRLVLAIQG